ncbi:MAG: DUF4423 domain-containing protein [Oligoflexales bacterium]
MNPAILTFIEEAYENRKRKNRRYSLRAFARDLELDSATLSKILKSKRTLGFKASVEILNKLGLPSREQQSLLFPNQTVPTKQVEMTPLSEEETRQMASWRFHAVLSALELPSVSTASDIAAQINCSKAAVAKTLQTLERLGFVKRKNSVFELSNQVNTSTTPGISPEAVRKCLKEYNQMGSEFLNLGSPEADFSGVTFVMSKEKLSIAKDRIRSFRRELAAFLMEGDPEQYDDVFRLNIHFFPVRQK